jgi:hypothetical protein
MCALIYVNLCNMQVELCMYILYVGALYECVHMHMHVHVHRESCSINPIDCTTAVTLDISVNHSNFHGSNGTEALTERGRTK